MISKKQIQKTAKKFINSSQTNSKKIDPITAFYLIMTGYKPKEIENNKISADSLKQASMNAGKFWQEILGYIDNWEFKDRNGWDLINKTSKEFAEVKNNHNTTNSDSSRAIFERAEKQTKRNKQSRCYLVEINSKKSTNKLWIKKGYNSNNRIIKISVDQFLNQKTGSQKAFIKILKDIFRFSRYEKWLCNYAYLFYMEKKYLGFENGNPFK